MRNNDNNNETASKQFISEFKEAKDNKLNLYYESLNGYYLVTDTECMSFLKRRESQIRKYELIISFETTNK